VFPLHADARSLPFAPEFFDAIVCIDSFPYFGTDDLYLNYVAHFVKPGGPIGVAGAGLVQEIEGPIAADSSATFGSLVVGAAT
jgi:ubiquinone/menaquinone biosynthesis C-methylase UbiE